MKSRVLGEKFLPADDMSSPSARRTPSPGSKTDVGIELDKWHVPAVDKITIQSTPPGVFFGGDSAFGPKNIIWAVEHGHQAAISIHKYCQGEDLNARPIRHGSRQHQDGHPRVELQQRFRSHHPATGAAREPQGTLQEDRYRGGAGLTAPNTPKSKSSAASTATSRRCSSRR